MPAHDVRLPLVCPAYQIIQCYIKMICQRPEIVQSRLLFSIFVPLVLASEYARSFCGLCLRFFSLFTQFL